MRFAVAASARPHDTRDGWSHFGRDRTTTAVVQEHTPSPDTNFIPGYHDVILRLTRETSFKVNFIDVKEICLLFFYLCVNKWRVL